MHSYILKAIMIVLQIGKLYECVPRSAIDKFVELCLACHTRKPQNTRGPLKPIISSGFMTRGQVLCINSIIFDALTHDTLVSH